ncbi:MAG: SGNH/GDSL hydrolase family protein [Parabacteroides sp.]
MRYFFSFIMILSLLTCNLSCDKEEVFITWEQERIETSLSIGSELYAVVGDTLRIYFQSILINANSNYILGLQCEKGNNYTNYWQYVPQAQDVGECPMYLSIYNIDGSIIAEKTVKLTTKIAINPSKRTSLLCIGNSLMEGGQTPIELSRRLKGTAGLYQTPQSLSLSNYYLTGRLQNKEKSVGWEGTGGWTWYKYIQTFHIKEYVSQYCDGNIDYIYLQLGINELLYLSPFEEQTSIINNAKEFISTIHKAYPQCKILLGSVLLPSQNGGLGANYPANEASGIYGERGFNLKVHKLNQAYDALAHSEAFASYTYFIDNNSQFDCLHAYPTQEFPAGNYEEGTEIIGTNGVHPTDVGYAQIAAGIFRAIVCLAQ